MLGSHPRGSGSSRGGGILASLTMSPVQTPVKTSVTTPVNTPAKTQSLAPKPPSESRPTPTKTSVKTPQLCYAPAGREKVCDCRVGRCRIGVSCSLRLSVGRSIRLDGRVSLIGGSPSFSIVSPLYEMVWLGQLFVPPLVSICLPTCFLARLLICDEMGWKGLSSYVRQGWSRSDGALSPLDCLGSLMVQFLLHLFTKAKCLLHLHVDTQSLEAFCQSSKRDGSSPCSESRV